jgi:hypothetical protein
MTFFPSVDFGRHFLAQSTKISKSKDMRNRNENNVSEWSNMSTHGLIIHQGFRGFTCMIYMEVNHNIVIWHGTPKMSIKHFLQKYYANPDK